MEQPNNNYFDSGDIYFDEEYYKDPYASDFTSLIGSPFTQDRKVIEKTIYEDRCLGRENTAFNRFRKKVVTKALDSDYPSIAAEILDEDYLKAIKETNLIYDPIERKFIGLYINGLGDRPKLVAFSTFDALYTIEDPKKLPVVGVHDLHVVNRDRPRGDAGDLDYVRAFYRFLLKSIEEFVSKSDTDTVIDFKTLGYDGYTWGIIDELGYEVINGSENDDVIRFTKVISGKGLQNEGNPTRK